MLRKIIAIALSVLPLIANSQDSYDFMTGLLPDDGTYNTLPEKAQLIARDYTVLPSAHSLKRYTPVVRSQSQFGTCTAWATVYAGRTIAEAVSNGWTDQQRITREAFSPLYVYAQIKHSDDPNCQRGSHIFHALDILKSQGVVKISDFDNMCANSGEITPALTQKAAPYKIDDYFTLFKLNALSNETKVNRVKKAIAEDCPVLIAMHLPKSFHQAGGDWSGIDVDPSKHGYHAMCVVGYDDNHPGGGAFEIMNSWGRNWGDQGFTWVKYNDFGKYVDQAYEMYVSKKDNINPLNGKSLGGEIVLRLSTGEEMKARYNESENSYLLTDSYISGTRYRAYITNNEPAYVYVIGSDLTNTPTTVFPPSATISPALTYKSNSVAIPDERYYIEMDQNSGIDYMCVLYSLEPLDINLIKNQIKAHSGSFVQKVHAALGNKLVTPSAANYGKAQISFKATNGSGTVVPIIIEIPHT